MRTFLYFKFLLTMLIGLVLAGPAYAGLIEFQVIDDKGSVTIQPGDFEHVFTSHMSLTLGAEWGELAGHFERDNGEKLVWVNNGPAITIDFANVFPVEVHVPQNPTPNSSGPVEFFDIFTEIDPYGNVNPLEPGMGIEWATFQGASGTLYPGIVTPINDLSQLPTSSANDTQIVWDLSRFSATTGNFYLIQYDLPNAFELTGVPEPSTLLLLGIGLAGLAAWRGKNGRS